MVVAAVQWTMVTVSCAAGDTHDVVPDADAAAGVHDGVNTVHDLVPENPNFPPPTTFSAVNNPPPTHTHTATSFSNTKR